MADFGLTISVHDTTNDGPPIPHASVHLEADATTDAQGNAVADVVYVTVTAEGFTPYVHQPYERPSLQAPVTVSLQRAA